jgi:hypothetical protein
MRRDGVHSVGIDGQRFQGGAREILPLGVQLLHDVIREVQPNSHLPSIEHGTVSGQLRVVAADPGSSISGSATQSWLEWGSSRRTGSWRFDWTVRVGTTNTDSVAFDMGAWESLR